MLRKVSRAGAIILMAIASVVVFKPRAGRLERRRKDQHLAELARQWWRRDNLHIHHDGRRHTLRPGHMLGIKL